MKYWTLGPAGAYSLWSTCHSTCIRNGHTDCHVSTHAREKEMRRRLLLLLAALVLPSGAFTPRPAAPAPRHEQQLRSLSRTLPVACTSAVDPAPPRPPVAMNGMYLPLPEFEWPVVLFFMANPLVLLPVSALAAFCFKIKWAGLLFSMGPSAAITGALLAIPLLALSLLADRVIPALAEVTQASKCISLYAIGSRFAPLRATAAALLISTCAAVAEELAFRGCLQTGIVTVLAKVAALSSGGAAAIAVTLQALVFGALHSYSSRYEYLATATVAGLAFGAVFAATSNIYVPMVMHFIMDVVGFLACHWQVTQSTEAEQRALLVSDAPIANQLAATLGARIQAQQKRRDAAGRTGGGGDAA